MARGRLPIPLAAALLLVLGVGGRIALHDYPNFETVMVAALLAALLLPTGWALATTTSIMLLSDWYLGYTGNAILWFTWSGFALVALAARLSRRRIVGRFGGGTVTRFAGAGVLFALVFDTWTNFGVWWLWYPHTAGNFMIVYALGVPFMIYHICSSVITFTLLGLPLWLALGAPGEQPAMTPVPMEVAACH